MDHLSEEEVHRLFEGDVSPSVEQDWMDHIEECDQCRSLYTSIVNAEETFIDFLPSTPLEKVRRRWKNGSECPPIDQILTLLKKQLPRNERLQLEDHLRKCDFCLHEILLEQEKAVTHEEEYLDLDGFFTGTAVSIGDHARTLLSIVVRLGKDTLDLISQTGQIIIQQPKLVRRKENERQTDESPAIKARKDDIEADLSVQINIGKSSKELLCEIQLSVMSLSTELPLSGIEIELKREGAVIVHGKTDMEGLVIFTEIPPGSYIALISAQPSVHSIRIEVVR